MTALFLENVHHSYDVLEAVEDVSLELGSGEVVCLLGPSGCGKTTVLRLAAGLEQLQQGRILMDGMVVAGNGSNVPPESRGVGLVFQDYALFPHLTVFENVAFGLQNVPASERRKRCEKALSQVGMENYGEAFPHTLSGGQQQRVALARALAPEPKVMLLDEPFSGLDYRLRNQIRDETLHILKESGAATLLVTHDPEEAMFMADRIALMRAGRIVQLGQPVDLYCLPENGFVAGFFGDINQLEGIVEGGSVKTPFGVVLAEGIGDGTEVEILIRPEALRLETADQENSAGENLARVMASRMLGRTSLVHLAPLDWHEHDSHLHARIPGRFLPPEDELLRVSLDHSQTFVFPRQKVT